MSKPHTSRNRPLGLVSRFGRSAMYRKRALYKKQKPKTALIKKVLEKAEIKPLGSEKSGGLRVISAQKKCRFYPSEDIKRPLKNRKKARPPKFRASLKPGTVVIILSGRHKSKRAILLKTLPSGLLLVTGPFQLNGIPLRRINPAYVIATSTRVDISSVNLEKFCDSYFAAPRKIKKEKSEGKKKNKQKVSLVSKQDQNAVDLAIMPLILKTMYLERYLRSSFTLKNGQHPHLMKF